MNKISSLDQVLSTDKRHLIHKVKKIPNRKALF